MSAKARSNVTKVRPARRQTDATAESAPLLRGCSNTVAASHPALRRNSATSTGTYFGGAPDLAFTSGKYHTRTTGFLVVAQRRTSPSRVDQLNTAFLVASPQAGAVPHRGFRKYDIRDTETARSPLSVTVSLPLMTATR